MPFKLGNKINLGKKNALGYRYTPEQSLNLSNALKGKIHNEGDKNPFFGRKHSIETKIHLSGVHKEKPAWNKGKKSSLETRMKISIAGTKRRGDKSSRWEGGKTSENKRIRGQIEYKLWRKAVFERDNYTCVSCKKYGGYLEADHIKQFAYYPELRFAIDNGRTLCKPCHEKTDTYKVRLKQII